MVKIMLDAGHDINTPGKRALDGSMREFEFNKVVAEKVAFLLSGYQGVEVLFSHDLNDGVDTSLDARANHANQVKADVFVSIHGNAGATSAQGIETYIYTKAGQRTLDIATLIHNHTINATGRRNRGVKRADFAVLRLTAMEAVLIECGFFTNPEELALMKTDGYRHQVAVGITNGLVQAFSLQSKPKPAPQPTPVQTNGLFKVQVGAFSVKDNADRLAAELKGKGYPAIVINE